MRRLIPWMAGTLVLALLGIGAVVWTASTELIAPARRALQDYHKEWLERPYEHGMRIRRFDAIDGQVPCLLAEPNEAAGLSKRGETVRRQLEERDVVLAPFGKAFANLVLLHGRNGRKEDLLPVAERFCAVGFRCVIPDMPTQGESQQSILTFGLSDFEASLPSGVLEDAVAQFGIPLENAGLWGMSMGGAFLARAASLPEARWKALVVVCSFDTLDAVVERKAASYVGPVAPLFTRIVAETCMVRGGANPAQVQPARWAAQITTPVFVAHGDEDELILPEQGRRLYEAYGSPDKVWMLVKGGSHDRILVTEHPLYADMSAWFLKYLRPVAGAMSSE